MSSFNFPLQRAKYGQVSNISILQSLLKDDARRQTSIRINPFRLIINKKYGYINVITAKCRYCSAYLKFKGTKTSTEHLKDQHRYNNDSTHSNLSYEKIVNISYRLTQFNNVHQHDKEQTFQEQTKRKNLQKNELIIDYYESLVQENTNKNQIRFLLKQKFGVNEHELYRITHPFDTVKRLYDLAKKRMIEMNFVTIQKLPSQVDINKIKSNQSSYINFPSQFTIITPSMVQNFKKYGFTVYFGVYPQYISQSKRLLLVGGFYGINQHHIFVPFSTVVLSIFKKEEEVINISNFQDIIDKDDDEVVKLFLSIFRTFFKFYNSKFDNRNFLLVVRQTNNTQAAIYEMRKQFPNLSFIYCFREKLNALQLQVNRRYCNDSFSSQEKIDFITTLYSLVKTLEEQEYSQHLKSLFKKANTNNTLLLQKITQDSHLFCFSKIKQPSNNLYEQCLDEFLRRKYHKMLGTTVKSRHIFMRTIMKIIDEIMTQEKAKQKQSKTDDKNEGQLLCKECVAYRASDQQEFFNEIELFETRIPQLKQIRAKLCIKTFCLVLKQLVKCLNIKAFKLLDDYNQRQYFVFKNGLKFKIVENQKTEQLSCQCQISRKYGIPCSHELFVCINLGIKMRKQLNRWLL